MFCRSLFVLLFFFFWALCCLFFFDIWILFSPFISLNSSRGPFKWIQMCRSIPLVAYIYVVVGDPIFKGLCGSVNNSWKPITNIARVHARLCNLQKGCTRLRPQVIKFTSCLPMVGGFLRLLPPLKLVAMI